MSNHFLYSMITTITIKEQDPEKTLTSNNSVGSTPAPTLVVYAFTTPYTCFTAVAGKPSPVHAPPTPQLLDVT